MRQKRQYKKEDKKSHSWYNPIMLNMYGINTKQLKNDKIIDFLKVLPFLITSTQ